MSDLAFYFSFEKGNSQKNSKEVFFHSSLFCALKVKNHGKQCTEADSVL